MSDRVDINNLLQEMRALKSQTQAFARPEGLKPAENGLRTPGTSDVPSFGQVMAQAVNKVNETQQASSALAQAYERGEPGVDITDVMVASQKASVRSEEQTSELQ